MFNAGPILWRLWCGGSDYQASTNIQTLELSILISSSRHELALGPTWRAAIDPYLTNSKGCKIVCRVKGTWRFCRRISWNFTDVSVLDKALDGPDIAEQALTTKNYSANTTRL